MKINIKKYIQLLLLSLVIASCSETIEWEVDESEIRLVVEGSVTDELKRHQVKLTTTSSYFNSELPSSVSNAIVTISDGSQTYELIEEPAGSGIYISEKAFQGEVGKTYQLVIDLEKPIREEVHYTAASTIRPLLQIDSIHVEETDIIFSDDNGNQNFAIILFGKELDTSGDFYLFKVYQDGKLINESAEEFVVMDDELINGEELIDFYLYLSDAIEAGKTTTLEVFSIDRDYYDFWVAFFEEIQGQDPMGMGSPPANVKGNISNGGLGYFHASSVGRYEAVATEMEE